MAPDAAAAAKIGFSFSPAGLLFPYFIGVAYTLQGHGAIDASTPLGGSSAGSIVAGALACDISKSDVRGALSTLSERVRGGETLNCALRAELDNLLPDDAPQRAESHKLRVCYLQLLPRPKAHEVTEWTSKDDLIDTVCASCNWPFFFSRWPLVRCRRGLALDGFFTQPRGRFGCPLLMADRTVLVTALPGVPLEAAAGDIIQPGHEHFTPPPLPRRDWIELAFSPASETMFDQMMLLGEQHAHTWLQQEHAVAAPADDQ